MTDNNDDLWRAIGSVALGVVGGYLLIELLKNARKCKSCQNQLPPENKICPYCGVQND